MVERIEQFDAFPSCSGLREHSVCTTSVTNLQIFPAHEHAPVVATDHFNHVPVVTGTVPRAFSAESREIGRSVMKVRNAVNPSQISDWGPSTQTHKHVQIEPYSNKAADPRWSRTDCRKQTRLMAARS